jgi:membrane protease YdiL (CAAX protease family)
MADDSGSHTSIRLPGGQPLFEFGNAEQRRVGLIHSVLLVLGSFVCGGLFVSVGGGALDVAGVGPDTPTARVVETATNFLGLAILPLAYLAWREEWSLVGFSGPTRRDIGAMLVGAVALIAFMLAGQRLVTALGYKPAANAAVETGRENPELFLYYIPIVLLLNSPAEELLFRGVVQNLLRRAYGVIPGILGASAIFGLVHYSALVAAGSAGAYVVLAIGSGIILGVLYEYTENLLVPIIVHAAWNCLVYLSLYAETTGVV